jgi:hypothetical protein
MLTMVEQRSLTLQPGNSLVSPKLTLSVGFSMSIALRAVTQARQLLALTYGQSAIIIETQAPRSSSPSDPHAALQRSNRKSLCPLD